MFRLLYYNGGTVKKQGLRTAWFRLENDILYSKENSGNVQTQAEGAAEEHLEKMESFIVVS